MSNPSSARGVGDHSDLTLIRHCIHVQKYQFNQMEETK